MNRGTKAVLVKISIRSEEIHNITVIQNNKDI